MTDILERKFENFDAGMEEFISSSPLTKREKAQKLVSQAGILAADQAGIEHLYNSCLKLEKAGLFSDSAWSDPERQVPFLVKGTLSAGPPTSDMEILNELRMLAHASGRSEETSINSRDAHSYLLEVLVHNLEFVFQELTEETRSNVSGSELKKIYNLFSFILTKISIDGIKHRLAEEIRLICEQRPIVTRKVRRLIHLINDRMQLNVNDPDDERLLYYVNAVKSPTPLTRTKLNTKDYREALLALNAGELKDEAKSLAKPMRATGLATAHLAVMLHILINKAPYIVPQALRLNKRGEAEWHRHQDFVIKLISEVVSEGNYQCIYGLARLLERGLLSRNAVKASLNNLRMIRINPEVEKNILMTQVKPSEKVTAKQYLIAATIRVLGQPLGIGQGNNSTCQSARGISMWSQHASAKLINMIITVAAQNNLILRFENKDLESIKLGKGLVDKLDFNLDAVSAVLVPHLDKIYNEMMRLASGRGEDPHKWVNPALYGHWIQIGFASAYSYLTNSIQDYEGFTRLLYATVHPAYNGHREMVYPNPVGIFITSKSGAMVGFHAISLLRVQKGPSGEYRAYFLNPNNEGRQNWGQEIRPSVHGHGERHGESSLPFHQLASRIYAFHFNSLESHAHLGEVPEEEVQKVKELARESWGSSYTWSDLKKLW